MEYSTALKFEFEVVQDVHSPNSLIIGSKFNRLASEKERWMLVPAKIFLISMNENPFQIA